MYFGRLMPTPVGDKTLGNRVLYKGINVAVMYYSANSDNLLSAVKGNTKRIYLRLSAVRFCSSLVCMYVLYT